MITKYYIKCVESQKYLGKLFEDSPEAMFNQDKPNNYQCYWYIQLETAHMLLMVSNENMV